MILIASICIYRSKTLHSELWVVPLPPVRDTHLVGFRVLPA